jgi:hypothetical protein
VLKTKNEWPEAAETTKRLKTAKTPGKIKDNSREVAELMLLRDRLRSEGELELLEKISLCQKPLVLKCLSCGHRKEVIQRCKKRWCPCCARSISAQRSRELLFITERMRWKLFVTLTMRHDSEPSVSEVRKLVKCFGKFRRRKLWTCRTQGGVVTVEITGSSGNWHPHLHGVIDCQWLALKTPCPRRGDSDREIKRLCQLAQVELSRAWGKQVGQETASVWVKRAYQHSIAKEVAKYTVKAQDLIQFKGSTGDLIRALDKTRAFRPFGTAHGQVVKDIRAEARAAARADLEAWKEDNAIEDCCTNISLMPENLSQNLVEESRAKFEVRTRYQPRCESVPTLL